MVDNDVDLQRLFEFLQGRGYRVVQLPPEFRRQGDSTVLAECKRQDRVLLTHDRDFLDERRHPPETNPGVIVLPGGSGDVEDYFDLIDTFLSDIDNDRPLWEGTYAELSPGGLITVRMALTETGESGTLLFRIVDGEIYIWDDEDNE